MWSEILLHKEIVCEPRSGSKEGEMTVQAGSE